ncbi:hypothetical protein PybrP1_006756 [[Pythium] brassicae (nom. inval.)]|nr:hypothetical protein PybrP1_006756 [[Pythium] brassicae (nom. inval.)]
MDGNGDRAMELEDAEQQRRIDEARDREDELAVVREINIELSKTAMDEEQERRVREYEIAKVQEQLLRERSKSDAIEAAERERERRLSELEELAAQDEQERALAQQLAVQEMEKERVRRLSSQEHFVKMATRRRSRSRSSSVPDEDELKSSPTRESETSSDMFDDATDELKTADDASVDAASDEVGDLSEIPVVHAQSSKILVDEHSEWRCYIASDSPELEADNLRALRLSLDEELKAEIYAGFQELVGDVRLLRFLRGHKMNVSVAATKFREMLAMRQQLHLNEIRTAIVEKNLSPDEFPYFQKIIPHLPFLQAYDLGGVRNDLVFYFEMTGYADLTSLAEHVSDDEWQTFFLYDLEYRALRLDQLSRAREQLVQSVFVRDLTGFSLARVQPRMLARLQHTIGIATRGYPEMMFETLLLRTPWVFHKLWHAVTALLHETQLRKVRAGDSAYARLLELVGGRDKLPKLLGGRDAARAIPQTGFLGRNSYVLLCEDGATQAEIRAGGTLQLPFRMSANDTLCWEFEVKAHDVAFSVRFRTQGLGGAEEREKVPAACVAGGETVSGSFTATEDGTVVLAWDNAYSWARAKSVAYKAKVVKSTHDFSCLDISGNDCV